jgi:tetratricopeptide (TPR) repeat protein
VQNPYNCSILKLLSIAIGLTLAVPSAYASTPRLTMVRTSTMAVVGDQPPATLRDVAIQIEQFRAVVGGLIPNANRPPSLPTTVFVFGSRKSIEPFLPVADGRPAAVAGFFQQSPDANYIVMSLEGFEESAAIVYHEYTHLLIANAVRSVPIWLNEGLAEYYSSYTMASDGRTAEIGRPLEWRLGLLRERYLPLAEILSVDASTALHDESQRRSIFYAEAWMLTHYLLTKVPNGGTAINNYVTAMAEGRKPDEAFRTAFGGTPAEFDKLLRAYIQQPRFEAMRYTFRERLAVEQPSEPRSLSPVEADAWLGDLQRRTDHRIEGAARIEAAAAAAPELPIAQLALGLLRLSQERLSEAAEALERAQTLAPDDFATQLAGGMSLLRADRVESGALTPTALRALQRAVSLRPESSDAHAWLAYAQMQSNETLASADASIHRALALAPGRLDYHLRLADIRILEGRIEEASDLLTAIAAVRTDPVAAERAQIRLQAIAANTNASTISRSIETPPVSQTPSQPETGLLLQLRKVQEGEERAFGTLERIDCTRREVRFQVRTPERLLIATAKRMEDVDFIQYLNDRSFTLACGARSPGDTVFLTWRPETRANGTAGTAVAVEFLPKDYVP